MGKGGRLYWARSEARRPRWHKLSMIHVSKTLPLKCTQKQMREACSSRLEEELQTWRGPMFRIVGPLQKCCWWLVAVISWHFGLDDSLCWGCPEHWKVLSNIPGFYPTEASSIPLVGVKTENALLPTFPNVSWGANSSLTEKHQLMRTASLPFRDFWTQLQGGLYGKTEAL